MLFLLAAQVEPVALVDIADAEKQHAQADETEDAQSPAQFADIDKKHFGNGGGKKDERLPAQECGSLDEANGQERAAKEHEERRIRELRIHPVIAQQSVVAVALPALEPPIAVNLQAQCDQD